MSAKIRSSNSRIPRLLACALLIVIWNPSMLFALGATGWSKSGEVSSAYAGDGIAVTLTPNNKPGSGNTVTVTLTCTGGTYTVSPTTNPYSWSGNGVGAKTLTVTPTQAPVTLSCTYALTGNAANNYQSISGFTVTVNCQMSAMSSAALGPYQPGAGLACSNRDNLVAFYPFTNGIANRDTSVTANNPTTQGTITYTTDKYSNANCAGVFDGSSSILVSSYVVQTTVWAISFWFATTDPNAGFNCVVGTSSGYDRCLRLTSGRVSAYFWQNAAETIISPSGTTYNDGNWHHLVYQYGPSQSEQIYMDNSVVATGSKTWSSFNWNTNINFGYNTQAGTWLNGKLDNIAQYSTVIAASDVASLFSSGWIDQVVCLDCGTVSYTASTPYSSFVFTATFAGTKAVQWKFNSGTLAGLTSGTATTAKSLTMGSSNVISIVAGEGTYTITVTRVCDLFTVTFSPAATFTPALTCGTYYYSASVPYSTSSLAVTITYLTTPGTVNHVYAVGTNTITSNLGSGTLSGSGNLQIKQNYVYVNGSVEGNYIFTITRLCDITALSFTPAITLVPAFACDQATYTAAVSMSVTTLSVTASFATGTHEYTVNGYSATYYQGLTNNVASPTNAAYMYYASNSIVISQTNGPSLTITVQRLTDAQSMSLSSSAGSVSYSPGFVAGTLTGYTCTLPFVYSDLAATMVTTVATAQFIINSVVVDPSMTSGQPSLSGRLLKPTAYSSVVNTVQAVDSIDGAYTVSITILPQDVRNFQLQCTTVFGATGIVMAVPIAPGQMNLNISMHARYGTCQLAVTYLTAGTVTISSPSEPYSGNAAATTAYSTHVINLPLGTPLLMNVTSTLDGIYSLNITRNAWDVSSIDFQVGGGPASQWYLTTMTYSPSYIQTTPTYTASVKYLMTGVAIRAMCNSVISAEMIRSGGPFVNMMPTGFTAPFTLNVGANLLRFISAKDNGSPYPSIGYSSYNFTITRTPSSLTGIAMKVSSPLTTWTANIKPAFSVDVFNYAVDVPLLYTAVQFAPSFSGTNTITVSFSGSAGVAITTTATYTSLTTLLTGLASANGANYFTFNSVEDGLFTIVINRPVDVKSIVAYTDAPGSSGVAFTISPSLLPTYYSYTITVPFKTSNIQLYVNYTASTTLQNQNAVFTPISPNVNTANIPTSYASPVVLTLNNTNDGVYTIQILYQQSDVQALVVRTNLGKLTLSPSFTNNTFAYTAYSYGSLTSLQLTTTYSTPSPPVNVTANGQFIGLPNSLSKLDLSSVLTSSAYLTTGIVTVLISSPYDGQYTISIIPACPQSYMVTPGTPATPLCQFFASYCTQPTSGYTRVCLLTRPGCCGDPACLC